LARLAKRTSANPHSNGGFRRALETVDRLFVSVRPGDEAADATAGPLVDEAVRRGVRHIVTLTAMGAERVPDNALRRIERQVEASGATWTHLRPNFFMQIFAVPPLVLQLRAIHSLRVPAADARLSFVDVRDVGAVAVVALLDGRHSGKAYTLTGGEAIDHGAVTHAISRATSQAFNYVPIGEEQARHLMAAGGLPPARVERLIGFYRLVRAGACAELSPNVAGVLGRPPIGFDGSHETTRPVGARPRLGRKSGREPSTTAKGLIGGRICWAHLACTRINIGPTIPRNQVEEVMRSLPRSPRVGDCEERVRCGAGLRGRKDSLYSSLVPRGAGASPVGKVLADSWKELHEWMMIQLALHVGSGASIRLSWGRPFRRVPRDRARAVCRRLLISSYESWKGAPGISNISCRM
jgi:uncharacterized protein YbjT (DUF2867 family)